MQHIPIYTKATAKAMNIHTVQCRPANLWTPSSYYRYIAIIAWMFHIYK